MELLKHLEGIDYKDTNARDFENLIYGILSKEGRVWSQVIVNDRGDGRRGKVDFIWQKEKEIIGIEIDYKSPRKKSIFKLKQLNANKGYILLRSPFKIIEIY